MAANKFFQQELFKFSIFPKYQSCIDDLATNLADPEEWDFSDDKRKSHALQPITSIAASILGLSLKTWKKYLPSSSKIKIKVKEFRPMFLNVFAKKAMVHYCEHLNHLCPR